MILFLKPLKSIACNIISIFMMIIIMVGCSSMDSRNDIKGVCKSCKPYYVRGQWHNPQLHYDYDEVGIASWYGPGFHSKKKANGEKFDQHRISAAHKTLPLPTVVEVTNLKNGKQIQLVVDDRGPFIGDRIIDLSKGAALQLGLHGHGVGEVRVRALEHESHKLANYLSTYGNKKGHDHKGRTWRDIYYQEILGHPKDPHLKQQLIYKKPKRSSVHHQQKIIPLKRTITHQLKAQMIRERMGKKPKSSKQFKKSPMMMKKTNTLEEMIRQY
jgi:rare lipoprotein A